MKERFPKIVNVKFTAQVENDLDSVQSGESDWVETLDRFYGDFDKTLKQAKEEMKDVVNLQISAFPQDAIFTNPDGARLMDRAMAMGADCVGGAPHLELTREDGVRDVVYAFDLAEKYGKLVDLHVDETADGDSHFVEVVAASSAGCRDWFPPATSPP